MLDQFLSWQPWDTLATLTPTRCFLLSWFIFLAVKLLPVSVSLAGHTSPHFSIFFKHILLSLILGQSHSQPFLGTSLLKPRIQATSSYLSPCKALCLGLLSKKVQATNTSLHFLRRCYWGPCHLYHWMSPIKAPHEIFLWEFTAKKSSSTSPEELSIILSDYKDYVTVHAPVLSFSCQQLGSGFEAPLRNMAFRIIPWLFPLRLSLDV